MVKVWGMPYPKPYSYLAYVLAAKQVKYEGFDAT